MKALRIGLCGLLAFSVLAHGVVEPWSEAILEIGAAVMFLWWGFLFGLGRVPVRWHRLLWPMAAFWILAASQYETGMTAVGFSKLPALTFSTSLLRGGGVQTPNTKTTCSMWVCRGL